MPALLQPRPVHPISLPSFMDPPSEHPQPPIAQHQVQSGGDGGHSSLGPGRDSGSNRGRSRRGGPRGAAGRPRGRPRGRPSGAAGPFNAAGPSNVVGPSNVAGPSNPAAGPSNPAAGPSGTFAYNCELGHCNYGTNREADFVRHQDTFQHTGLKPYACTKPDCDKSYTRPDSLKRHERTHDRQ
ncbi:hypothetical protein F5887DRAFT_957555 [Amanita rubescens]|nr:hypothetical protein F5887DRAFT_957555 [Amanita rubescens]